MVGQVDAQGAYHRELYQALWDWPAAERSIAQSRLRGMDLLGHFGAEGCELITEAIAEHRHRGPLHLLELGSGIGGVLRQVLSMLHDRVPIALAVGCELVEEHCRLARRIDQAVGMEPRCVTVCASVEATGLRSGAFDVVFATGAVSHFADMPAAIAEAYRLLRPGGLLTFTEEVSLLAEGAEPSAAFRDLHPPEVFFTATWPERRTQLEAAGFAHVMMRDLGEWASALLRRRLLALRVQRRAVAAVYGEAETQRIADTLAAAREEITNGRLIPAHVVAYR